MRARLEPAPAEAPPEWWGRLFGRRQRRQRALILRKLAPGGVPGAAWLSTQQVHQVATGYEVEETEHALASLCDAGLVECDPRYEPLAHNSSRMVHRSYWRATPCPRS